MTDFEQMSDDELVTVIPASRWNFDPASLDTGFQKNHGQSITTQDILNSMSEINARPEIGEINRLIQSSDMYLSGCPRG